MPSCEPCRGKRPHTGTYQTEPRASASGEEVADGGEVVEQATRSQVMHCAGRRAMSAKVERRERPSATGTGVAYGCGLLASAVASESVHPHNCERRVGRSRSILPD